jgi:hypothetical protein
MSANEQSTPGQRRHGRADCAWCMRDFPTIVELLDHVDVDHLEARPAAA